LPLPSLPRTNDLLRPMLTSLASSPDVAAAIVRIVRTQREISQGKLCILHSDFAGLTLAVYGMAIGSPRLMPGCPTTLALYPVSVRRIRVGGIGFLQIPPHDGHPCLALQFGPSPPAEDLHLLKTKHTWHT